MRESPRLSLSFLATILMLTVACQEGTGPEARCTAARGIQILRSAPILLKGLDASVELVAQAEGETCAPRWQSLNPAVAEVSESGVVTAREPGQALIQARAGEAVGTVVVTVAASGSAPTEWRVFSQPTSSNLAAVWGPPTGPVFAAGADGTILRRDDRVWSRMESGTAADLFGIWGWDASRVWAVGTGGTLLRLDGDAWTPIPTGTTRDLWAVWGPSPDLVYAFGWQRALRVVGEEAVSLDTGDGNDLYQGAWGFGPEDILIATTTIESSDLPELRHARVLHFDGTVFGSVSIPQPHSPESDDEMEANLTALHGSSPSSVLAVGYGSPLFHGSESLGFIVERIDSEWTLTMPLETRGVRLTGVWSTAPGTAMAAGRLIHDGVADAVLLQQVGGEWSQVEVDPGVGLADVWGSPQLGWIAVGDAGTVLENEGLGWQTVLSPLSPVRALWGWGDQLAAVGPGSSLFYDGAAWSPVLERVFRESLTDVWGAAPDHLLAVGAKGAVLSYDGVGWRSVVPATGLGWLMEDTLHSVWGSSLSHAVAVGFGGAIFESGGGGWGAVSAPTTRTLRGVWGFAEDEIYAVGDAGVILRFNGHAWAAESSGTEADLTSVWGTGPDSLYAVGAGGTILRRGLDGWTSMSSPSTVRLESVAGTAGDNVYAAGAGGTLLRFDGTGWQPLDPPTTESLRALWAGGGGVWAVSTTDPTVIVEGRAP